MSKTPETPRLGGIIPVLLVTAALAMPAAVAAVPVFINSGDPAFPFPQFLPYAHPNGDTLHNLATKGPAGVTHAEMEKSIRDAYQIMMNRAKYEGTVALRGVKYIYFESEPFCSEGTGYAMLAAAMMADKTTFDGLWLYTHDYAMNNVVRYIDGRNSPAYSYSTLPGWKNDAGGNSAADGDFDIALALMIAHAQWGDNMGINDSRGRAISYKADFIEFLKGLSDTLAFKANGNLLSGDIGLDGYFKGGDSWAELSGWAASAQNLASIRINNRRVEQAGPAAQHIDYTAPAYFRQFADYLTREDPSAYAWNISQFERAEASSDWLFGKLIQQNQRNIPFAGWVELRNDTTPVFTTFSDGEDFRAAWRTVLSYVWHGNPAYTWDPVKHTVTPNKPNTFQKGAGERFAKFLWDRRQSPWNQPCEEIIGMGNLWGPSALKYHYSPQGEALTVYPLNWVQGTGSPSAVAAQDTNLMAEMYRQCEITWDPNGCAEGSEEPCRYLTNKPHYFHGFFRLLGMHVLTGNHHAPMNMKRGANMKVYLDVDRTYAFENDTITYTIDYRNYGADTARGVVIANRLHKDFKFVSSTGGGSYSSASNSIRWNVGAVPGFKTSSGVNPTRGSVSFKVVIPNATLKRYENKAEIACANGSGWASNEYPNKISAVMKRNGVDIAKRALRASHSVVRDVVNPGMDVTYTIEFENSAEAGWLNGGRPGVNFTYGHQGTSANDGSHTFMVRAFNDAHEAYIDYGNYRISYFLFDNNYRGLGGANGWEGLEPMTFYPADQANNVKPLHENITPGEDSKGKWNQRVIIQIADVNNPSRTDTNWSTMAGPTPFLLTNTGSLERIHRGISWVLKGCWQLRANNYTDRNWGGDWSYNSRAVVSNACDYANVENWGYPISPDFTESYDPDYQGKPVTSLHRKLCGTPPSTVVDNVLIEEWDGYTWRRVLGNGPVPGREVTNVVIRDTLPDGITFKNFTGANPLGIAPKATTAGGRTIITWEIDKLLVGQSGKIQYVATANASQPVLPVNIPNRAWVSGDRESPISGTAVLTVTTDELPPPPPPPTSMSKTANKGAYLPGDTINYTIAYKQTHGYPVKSTSSSQWTGTGLTNVSSDGQTISLASATNVRFAASSGVNGTITGTVHTTPYVDPFYIVVRDGAAEIGFKHEWEGVYVTVSPNGGTPNTEIIAVSNESASLNFKVILRADTLLLWVNDTSAVMPYMVHTGITARAGTAGVRFPQPQYGSHSVTGWFSHFDMAYDVAIRDTIPFGVTYINGSATGRINTGALAPRTLTGTMANGVITWPVVSGSANPLGANDSLTVTWRGVVDTAKNRTIVNTAYTDLSGYRKDSIGAQLLSRFALDSADIVEPPDTTDTTGVPPNTGLAVRAVPEGGVIFTKQLSVTLTATPVSGADIYYTVDGKTPDPDWEILSTYYYDGQPLVLDASFAASDTAVTLKAVAYADGYEPSEVAVYRYVPLRTVPVQSAFFFDNVGDGKAHGIKLVLPVNRSQQPNAAVIRQHSDLIELPGMPAIDSLRVAGDTVTILFRGAGVDPPADVRLTIREPELPGSRYTSAHGYLAARSLAVIDGVAPVIVEAVYCPSLAEAGGGDTLAVTFNKYAALAQSADVIAPFALSYAGGSYTLELKYLRHDGNTIYFHVVAVAGPNPPAVPAQGDSIRIAPDGGVTNVYSYPQDNPKNRAVALKVRYPELDYVVMTGPNPFTDTLRVWISVEPHLPAVFEALDPKVLIYDRVGRVAAATGKNLKAKADDERYVLTWDGHNQKGRKSATGTYLVHVVVNDQDGNKKVIRRLVYLYRD